MWADDAMPVALDTIRTSHFMQRKRSQISTICIPLKMNRVCLSCFADEDKKCGDVHVDRVVGRLLGQLQKMQIGPLEAISRSVDAVSAAGESYPENVRPALLEMSRNGWYLDPAMPMSLPRRFTLAMEAGDAAQAEQSMVDHFERRTGGILSELVGRHPARGVVRNITVNTPM
ncbi:hypothetical protein BN2476_1340022 [Paraburkholderia piptadeniae]|uniref:Uncharacterized protein n=2 Tax=Paraburkholderia TaxID=1822464 RepID=A0A7X1NGW4_9BURK|nr:MULTISPECIES: hypothetical protein [Paraburkholderia]MPW21770.1 hypothetical protein [Paraburkholderia franconis]SIT51734.1 hypothetical protein BN2476_1340022 [Paraburkholderia piptadeniae]